MRHVCGIKLLCPQHLPGFLQTDLLDVLQGANAADCTKMHPESGWAHVRLRCQGLDVDGLVEVLLDPVNRTRDLLRGRSYRDNVA